MVKLVARLLFCSLLAVWSGAAHAQQGFTKQSLITQFTNCFPDQTSQFITPADMRTCMSNLINSYQQFPAVNPIVTRTYAFQVSDYGQLVTFNNSASIAVSIPAASTLTPWNAYVSDVGAGVVTITPPGGTTIGGATTLVLTEGQSAFIVSDGSNYQLASSSTSGGALGTMAFQNANAVAISGGTITGLPTPINPSDAAIKSYVDAAVSAGLTPHPAAVLATTTALPANTYNNGTAGVGATLTGNSNGILSIDGTVTIVNERVAIRNESAPANNGIYTVTTVGTSGTAYVLTRATDANTPGTGSPIEIGFGTYVLITGGATLVNTSWSVNSTVTTIGTSAINWAQFSGSSVTSIGGLGGAITCGNGLLCASGTISTSTQIFNTKALAAAATIPASVNAIWLAGYTATGDSFGQYVRVSSATSTTGTCVSTCVQPWFQSADGAYWQLYSSIVTPELFGAIGDGTTDDSNAIQSWINDCGTAENGSGFGLNGKCQLQGRTYYTASTINLTGQGSPLLGNKANYSLFGVGPISTLKLGGNPGILISNDSGTGTLSLQDMQLYSALTTNTLLHTRAMYNLFDFERVTFNGGGTGLYLDYQYATFTGTGSGTNLTVSGVTGYLAIGATITGTGVPSSTTIVSQTSGTPNGAGVYVTNNSTTSVGASLTAAGQNGSLTLHARSSEFVGQQTYGILATNQGIGNNNSLVESAHIDGLEFLTQYGTGMYLSGVDAITIDNVRFERVQISSSSSPIYIDNSFGIHIVNSYLEDANNVGLITTGTNVRDLHIDHNFLSLNVAGVSHASASIITPATPLSQVSLNYNRITVGASLTALWSATVTNLDRRLNTINVNSGPVTYGWQDGSITGMNSSDNQFIGSGTVTNPFTTAEPVTNGAATIGCSGPTGSNFHVVNGIVTHC